MKKSFKYRIYPNDSQIKSLEKTFNLCRFLYNSSLEERISYYQKYGKYCSCYDQINELPEIKELLPEFNDVYSQVLQSTLKRSDASFKNFFRNKEWLNTNSEGSGFPRFKNKFRFRSILYTQSGFKIEEKSNKFVSLFLSKIGHIKFVMHREIQGTIKTCQIVRAKTNKWFVVFSCDAVPLEPLAKTEKSIGIDLGVKTYITKSDGNIIENPKYLKKSERKLTEAERKFSKIGKKDSRRNRARFHLARIHEKVSNQREDFQHKLSLKLVKEFDILFLEDLNIKGMKSYRNLNKSVYDCGWGKLVHKISYKAESAGKKLILVDPKNTTKMCSKCGKIIEKDLSCRIHRCDECGLEMDRDLNAALNIYNRGREKLLRESGITLFESSRSPLHAFGMVGE